ncbi:hypothetical protein DLJ53_16095 [Acuticoccus sediminis]|uniref:Phage terminase large subunit GpA ATPase domain-containing protein n=2 Tax=Acuticoccus sediminis TaxID=2184697 RepID=A0A8B2NU13_9HYPH|nr:hypothetical protein DLJ53_16095 [Acuticoccus sediminis]
MAANVIAPPPPIDYEAWAIENLTSSDRESPFVGRYNPELFPFFAGIFEALSPEDPCRTVTWVKSAQLGGTVVGTIFTLDSMDMDPCDFLFVHPTEDNGKRWSRLKLAPMMRSTPAIDAAFLRNRRGWQPAHARGSVRPGDARRHQWLEGERSSGGAGRGRSGDACHRERHHRDGDRHRRSACSLTTIRWQTGPSCDPKYETGLFVGHVLTVSVFLRIITVGNADRNPVHRVVLQRG